MLKDLLHVAHPLGVILMTFSLTFLAPMALSLADGDGTWWAFLLALCGNFLVGLALWAGTRRHDRELKPRDGYLLVSLVWIVLALSASVPLLLTIPGLSFTNAYFEAVAGVTTTNANVLIGLDQLPAAVNLWRCELQWLGGLGILVFAMAVLPLLGIGGMQVYRAEATGPIKESRLTPRFRQTARSLWSIYVALTVACLLCLRLAGMNWFDAVCHALTTLSLGGFSTHDTSIGYFNSPLIEFVLEVFMLLAAINFATHYAAWRSRRLRTYLRDPEARTMLIVVALSVLAIASFIRVAGVYPDFLSALRYGAFNLVSAATGSGFVNADYGQWPLFAGLWMLLLSCISASAGSTGGGLKMLRTIILFKQSGREIRSLVHPSAVTTLKVGGQVIPDRVVSAVMGFVHLYTLSVIVLSFLLILSGLDFVSSFSAVVSTLNNFGPGLHLVGPGASYAGLTDFQTWVCTVSMLLGRLEIFVLIVPLSPAFWTE